MVYVPHDWATGEVITEELLDHMEQGIGDASEKSLIVEFTESEGSSSIACNVSRTDIIDALNSGTPIIAKYGVRYLTIGGISSSGAINFYVLTHTSGTSLATMIRLFYLATNEITKEEYQWNITVNNL